MITGLRILRQSSAYKSRAAVSSFKLSTQQARLFSASNRTMTVTPITSFAQFKEIINKDQVSVIDFWATWCGPCRVISPIFETFASKYTNVQYYKVDVDEQSDISQEVGIRAMPTFVAFKNGEKIDELVGANPGGLENLIAKYNA